MNNDRYESDKEETQAIMAQMTALGDIDPRSDEALGLKALLRLAGRLLFLGLKISLGIDRNGYTVFRDLDRGLAVARYLLRLATLLFAIATILTVAFVPLLFINPLAAGAFLLVDLGIIGVIVVVFVLCFFVAGGGPGRGVRRGRFIADMGGAFGRFVGGTHSRA